MTAIARQNTDFSSESLTILEQQFETLEIVLPPSTPPQPTLEYESFEDNELWMQMKNKSSLFECPSDDEDEVSPVAKLVPAKQNRPGVTGFTASSSSSREVTKLGPFSLVAKWETALENILDKFGCGGGGGDSSNENSNKFYFATPMNNDDDDVMELLGLQFIPDDDANE